MGIGYTEGSGVTLATREVSEEHYQQMLVAFGSVPGEVADGNPLPVAIGASASVAAGEPKRIVNLSNSAQEIKSSSGRLYGLDAANINTQTVFLQLYDEAGSIVVGTTVPKYTIPVPPGDGNTIYGQYDRSWPVGLEFDNSIKVAVTTTPSGGTAPAANVLLSASYK